MDDEGRKKRYRPLVQMIIARLRDFWREPAAVFWVYGFPLIMMVALGVAFRNRPDEMSTVVVQQGNDSEHITTTLSDSQRFVVTAAPADEALQALRTGRADLLVVGNYAKQYGYHYDPTKPGGLLARNAVQDVLERAAGRQDVLTSVDHHLDEPGGRYIDFLVPGLIGMGLMGGGLWGVGFAIVDMRVRKLLKRFLATPMKRSHFLLSVMISRLIFLLPEVLFMVIISRILFGVVNQGSYGTIALFVVLGGFQFAGIGLLVACRARTLETVSGLMNLVMLPMWMASGIFFSADRFPSAIQPVLNVLPLKPLIDALRQTMLEGASISDLLPELSIMSVWTVVTFALALSWFRWE